MIKIQIITPERIVFEGQAEGISLPSIDGELTILKNHIPLIALLKSGEIALHTNKGKRYMAIHNGFFEVSENNIKILTDQAELEEEVDERRATEALERARLAKEQSKDSALSAQASAAIERALLRLKIAERRKDRHRA